LKVKTYWVFADFNYNFYVTSTILIGYSLIPLLFDTPC